MIKWTKCYKGFFQYNFDVVTVKDSINEFNSCIKVFKSDEKPVLHAFFDELNPGIIFNTELIQLCLTLKMEQIETIDRYFS